MGLFNETELRRSARSERISKSVTTASVLREERNYPKNSYDIFLCHSMMDEELIHGAKRELELAGFSVYVDWINDPLLDRSSVSAATADVLRRRMKSSRMLIYAHTLNSAFSRWCPWELGFFDGHKGGNVFLLPIAQVSDANFSGQEYIGLYPYLDKIGSTVFVNQSKVGLKRLTEAKLEIIPAR